MLRVKEKRHQGARSEGTDITVSVNERSLKDLEKFNPSTKINWAPVEKQSRKWSNLIRIGKKNTVVVTLNYEYEDDDGHAMSASRRVEKRGRVSRTGRMLAERDAYISADEERTGRPAAWSLVYERMRCHVRSCPLRSEWCWEDPRDKTHYKLRAPHLGRLVDYVYKGGSLKSHEDVPDDIRQDVVLESQAGRRSKKADNVPSSAGVPYPININVMSAETARSSTVTSSSLRRSPDGRLVITGPREAAVRKYCKWLESHATEEAYKADFRRICQVVLENQLDLELIFENPDAWFFTRQGVKLGTALRLLRDVYEWDKETKSRVQCSETVEETVHTVE